MVVEGGRDGKKMADHYTRVGGCSLMTQDTRKSMTQRSLLWMTRRWVGDGSCWSCCSCVLGRGCWRNWRHRRRMTLRTGCCSRP